MCPMELIMRIKGNVTRDLSVSVSTAGTTLGLQLGCARQNNSPFHSDLIFGLSSPLSCGDGCNLSETGATR